MFSRLDSLTPSEARTRVKTRPGRKLPQLVQSKPEFGHFDKAHVPTLSRVDEQAHPGPEGPADINMNVSTSEGSGSEVSPSSSTRTVILYRDNHNDPVNSTKAAVSSWEGNFCSQRGLW